MLHEEWRAIDGFPGYQVSSLGRVRSFRRGTLDAVILRPSTANKAGRKVATIYADGVRYYRLVARLVCGAFSGPPAPGQQAAHKNGNAGDDRADNLYWASPLQNSADRDRHGRTARGSRHYATKLTERDVAAIKAVYLTEKSKGRIYGVVVGLSRQYGVSLSAIEDIVYGKKWRHVA